MAAYRPTLRALAAVGILTAWGGSLTWLGLRRMETGSQAELSLLASRQLAPGEARFAVYVGDVQIGSAGITLDTLSPGYRIIETLTLETRGDTGLVRAVRWAETVLTSDLTPDYVSNRLVRDGQRHEGIARYDARRVTVRLAQAAGSGSALLPGIDPVHPLVALPFQIALRGDLQAGSSQSAMTLAGWPSAGRTTSWTMAGDSVAVFADSAVFDTLTLRWGAAHLDTAKVYAVEMNAPTGPYTVWIERTGTVAGIEYPLGTRWIRTDFNLAVSDFRRALAADRVSVHAIQPVMAAYATSAGRRDSSVTPRTFRLVRASGLPLRPAAASALSGGRQHVRGDTIVVRDSTARVPRASSANTSADPFIQRDASPIVALAGTLREGADQPIARLVDLVHSTVSVDTAYGAAVDALGTLRAGRGRPDGIARLFVALALERSIVARYVTGFAILDGVVLTHAWAETWTPGSGWTAVDPVMGRPVASTNLIRLGFAGSSHPEDLLTSLADVRLVPLMSARVP